MVYEEMATTWLRPDPSRHITDVVCNGCGETLSWYSRIMQIEEPERVKQLQRGRHECMGAHRE